MRCACRALRVRAPCGSYDEDRDAVRSSGPVGYLVAGDAYRRPDGITLCLIRLSDALLVFGYRRCVSSPGRYNGYLCAHIIDRTAFIRLYVICIVSTSLVLRSILYGLRSGGNKNGCFKNVCFLYLTAYCYLSFSGRYGGRTNTRDV